MTVRAEIRPEPPREVVLTMDYETAEHLRIVLSLYYPNHEVVVALERAGA